MSYMQLFWLMFKNVSYMQLFRRVNNVSHMHLFWRVNNVSHMHLF